jgi:hypothetical protein
MDLMDLLKLAGISVQMQPSEPSCGCGGSCGCGMSESDGAGFDKATTEPNPEELPDGISTLGSVSDTSLRRYLKARGDHVTVDEEIYPDYTVEDVAESYKAFTEKAKNPYAIGMAQAMKSTGDEPPLKKSTITKAHKIAKGIGESSMDDEELDVFDILDRDPPDGIDYNYNNLAKVNWDQYSDDLINKFYDYVDSLGVGDGERGGDGYSNELKWIEQNLLKKRGINWFANKTNEAEEDIKVGDTVKPTKGPHKGHPHEVIHDFGDGHYNVKPVGLRANQIRYGLGAAKAHKSDLVKEEITNEAAKPDYIDIDGDGDKKEPMKKAAKDKEETQANESLEYLKKLAGLA